ncbi:MAG: M23 family metallopeptidase, partial [Cyanobacteria bacterium J06649_4]
RAAKVRTGKRTGAITITPLRGFFITLLCLGVPTVSLGVTCLSLIQNNLRLSEENDELEAIASEVRADVDSLGEEIDTLRERAGVPKTEVEAAEEVAAEAKSATVWSDGIERSNEANSAEDAADLSSRFPPRGGPAIAVKPVDLLKDAQRTVPKLNKALAVSIKPALEEALAQEAAYPDGQPVVGVVRVSSEFGIRRNPFGGSSYEMHEGIDFAGDYGDIIAASGDGVVTLAESYGGYGKTVTIDHANGYETLYAHLNQIKVKVGDTVKRGQIVGYMGSTGRSTGPHLHYGIYKDEKAINPRSLMKLTENTVAQAPR